MRHIFYFFIFINQHFYLVKGGIDTAFFSIFIELKIVQKKIVHFLYFHNF